MNASSESGLWATRMVRGMGPPLEARSGEIGVGLPDRLDPRLRRLPEFVDHRLVLLVLDAARRALGGEMGLEVPLRLELPGGIPLAAGDRTADDVAEEVARILGQNGVGEREGAGQVGHLHAE